MKNGPQGSESMISEPPAIDVSKISNIAESKFGKSGTVSELGGERDQNFRIDTDTDAFVLKVINQADDREVLDFRTQALRHIYSSDPDLPVMEIVPTINGSPWTSIDKNDETHFVRMFTTVPGRKDSFNDLNHEALYNYGEVIARVGQALRGFFHPEARYELLWDLRHTSGFRSLLDNITDDQRRDIAEKVLDRFENRVDPVFNNLRAQVIHNDLRPDNVLLNDNNRVSGIIDFGDLTYTALVCDLAIVLASVMYRHNNPIGAAQSVTEGYVSVTPLEKKEVYLLPDLIMARLVIKGVVYAWQSERYSHNTVNIDGLWELLITLEDINLDVVGQRLQTAAISSNIPYSQIETSELITRRRQVLGSARLSYREPIHFVAGEGIWLFDSVGRRYLDAYNNVQVVGHANSDVTAAVAGQARKLATNTRYLHESIVTLSERLLDTMPDKLDRILLVNSGSEANDLAWRMATASTGQEGGVVSDYAYHGITDATTALSPKVWPDGYHPNHVKTVPPPIDGSNCRGTTAAESSEMMTDVLEAFEKQGPGIAAFLFDPLFTSDGILPPERKKLRQMVDKVHKANGVVIADEVQAGFGRTGSNLWGFQTAGIVPDIVTMGKPMGNGHPVAAVATRSDIASTLRDQTGVFSTFGGNPVSSVAALAVLDVIEDQGLLADATDVGEYLQAGLARLAAEHDLIGEVRQQGLMLGIELIQDQETLAPATSETTEVVNGLRQCHVLVGSTGKHSNVLKIRPPLVFNKDHADHLLKALNAVLNSVE